MDCDILLLPTDMSLDAFLRLPKHDGRVRHVVVTRDENIFGVYGSSGCFGLGVRHGYEQFNSIVTFNPVVMRSSLEKLAENSPCSNR